MRKYFYNRDIYLGLLALLIILCILCAGCGEYTENYQALTARLSADTATTALAEEKNLDSQTISAILSCAQEVETFLDQGSIAPLANCELAYYLEEQIPAEYRPYFAAALAYLAPQNVDIDALVDTQVLRLVKNAVHGVRTAAEFWVEPPPAAVEKAPGNCLRRAWRRMFCYKRLNRGENNP